MVEFLDQPLTKVPNDHGVIAVALATRQKYADVVKLFEPVITAKGIPPRDLIQYMKEVHGWQQLNLGNHDRAADQEAKYKVEHFPKGPCIFMLSTSCVYFDGVRLYDTDHKTKSGRQKIRTMLVPPDSAETVDTFWERAIAARIGHYGFDWTSKDFDVYYVKYGRRKEDRGGKWSDGQRGKK